MEVRLKADARRSAHLPLIDGRVGTPQQGSYLGTYMIGEKDGRVSAGLWGFHEMWRDVPLAVYFRQELAPTAFYSHRSRDRNPPRRSHKSNMVSIVATHSWRPRWVRN